MRIDNTGIYEIANSNIGTEMKESKAVGAGKGCAVSSTLTADTPYSITAATVEKALFSLESELDKIKQDAQSVDLDLIKTQMAILSNTLGGEELQKLQENGYSLNDTDIETIVTVVDKIKVELAKGGMDISVFGDDLSMEQLEAMTGSASQAKQMASELSDCQDGDIAYLVGNECEPTIENLYWAQHSGSRQQNASGQQADSQTLLEDENLRRQIEQVIAQANLPINDTTLGYGALLLNNQIPVTAENISYVAKLKELKLPLEETKVESAISTAVQEGHKPQEAYLLEGYSLHDRAVKAQETIAEAEAEDIVKLEEQGEPVNIENLARLQNESTGQEVSERNVPAGQPEVSERNVTAGQQEDTQETAVVTDDRELRHITARRQLEEIRLMMTAQASYQLLKQGISIETMELEQLVEELKGMETEYYKQLLQRQGIEPTTENTLMFRETIEKTNELQFMPSYILGRHQLESTSVQTLYEAGSQLKAVLEQANEAYETMMTMPRKDLGDSMQKAFQNVDDILADLELEISQPNQRAVRILAYNQMEITTESIEQVKAADEKMQNLFQNMKPQVVLEMVREGVHPLSMDVIELNSKAEEIIEQLDPGQEEKYSAYLWELEQKNEITQEEKESYIGIYRLLRQIEKTDGAVIGAVVNQGTELSLKNLLSAVRSRRTYGTEVTVDESFGGVSEVIHQDASISQQIDAAYQTDCAKEALKQLTQPALQKCMSQENWQELTPEQLLWQLKEYYQSEDGQIENQHYTNQMELFGANQSAEEAVLQMLLEYDLPMDTYHIMAAGQMVNNRNSVFRRLFDSKNIDKVPDLAEAKEEVLRRFAEAVKTPEDMAKAQQALAETAENIMETMIEEPDATSMDVRELKLLRTEIELNTKMSREENYAVPVMIADELTNVQLKIVRGKQKKGAVDILFETARLGKVAAHIQVSEAKLEGFIVAERTETLEQLKQQETQLSEQMQTEGQNVRFDFVVQEDLNLADFYQGKGNNSEIEKNTEEYHVQTSQLYTMAREFLEAVKQME